MTGSTHPAIGLLDGKVAVITGERDIERDVFSRAADIRPGDARVNDAT